MRKIYKKPIINNIDFEMEDIMVTSDGTIDEYDAPMFDNKDTDIDWFEQP